MPLPLAPIALFALRGTAVAAGVWAVRRGIRAITWQGRSDQRAEDVLDDLGEGLAAHKAATFGEAGSEARQTNAAARLRRVVRWRGKELELDAAFMARFRIRQR